MTLPEEALARALADEHVQHRYRAKVVTSTTGSGCLLWGGALMRSGHARFWLGTSIDGRDQVIIGHRYAYGLAYGVAALLAAPVLAHDVCDEPLCQAPDHLVPLSDHGPNTEQWARRVHRVGSPLRDVRGRYGRARAIRDAVRSGGDVAAAMSAGASDLDRLQLALF